MLTIDNTAWFAQLRADGFVKGKTDALISLLEGRFGALAPYRRKRIRGAKLETLDRWFRRAIVARDLPSVFRASR